MDHSHTCPSHCAPCRGQPSRSADGCLALREEEIAARSSANVPVEEWPENADPTVGQHGKPCARVRQHVEGWHRSSAEEFSLKRILTPVDGRMFGGCIAENSHNHQHQPSHQLQAGVGGESSSSSFQRKRKSSQMKIYDEGIDIDSQLEPVSDVTATSATRRSFQKVSVGVSQSQPRLLPGSLAAALLPLPNSWQQPSQTDNDGVKQGCSVTSVGVFKFQDEPNMEVGEVRSRPLELPSLEEHRTVQPSATPLAPHAFAEATRLQRLAHVAPSEYGNTPPDLVLEDNDLEDQENCPPPSFVQAVHSYPSRGHLRALALQRADLELLPRSPLRELQIDFPRDSEEDFYSEVSMSDTEQPQQPQQQHDDPQLQQHGHYQHTASGLPSHQGTATLEAKATSVVSAYTNENLADQLAWRIATNAGGRYMFNIHEDEPVDDVAPRHSHSMRRL